MKKQDFLKILSRFLKEENAYYLMSRINFYEHMKAIDDLSAAQKAKRFFDIFNKYCNWASSNEGYEFYYSLSLKLILFCHHNYSSIFSLPTLRRNMASYINFSQNFTDREYYKEAKKLANL